MNSPWTEFLAREGAVIDHHAVGFVGGTAPADATIVVPLIHLGLIRSTGEDSAAFLNNLFSNDVKKLGPDGAQWNSFNSPKGRMLANMLVWHQAGGHRLVLSADIHAAMLKKLSMYVLRSKVRLEDASGDTVLIGVSGPAAQQALTGTEIAVPGDDMQQVATGETCCVRLNDRSVIVAVPVGEAARIWQKLIDAGGSKAGTAAWELAMIRAGLPLITTPTQEEFVAQMLNYELIGGVSFNKGCYPGQEIVARTQYLGKLKKRMYRVRVAADEAPRPGTDVFTPAFGEQSAGKLVNSAPSPEGGFEALVVMQTSCAEADDAHLGSPNGPRLVFLALPYAVS